MATPLTRDWDDIPCTHRSAEPTGLRYVLDSPCVRIVSGRLRGSVASSVFELANVQNPFDEHSSNQRVQVKVG